MLATQQRYAPQVVKQVLNDIACYCMVLKILKIGKNTEKYQKVLKITERY